MAQEITIDINVVTNAAPAAAKISKELDGVKRKAKEVKDGLDEALNDTGKGDSKIKKGAADVETLKNALSPVKGLVSEVTGGMSDAFFQAFQSVKATTAGIKGLDLALKTAAFGIAILVIQEVINLYDQLVVSEEEEATALKAATDAKKAYNDATLATADALDKENKARAGGSNELKREIAELEASGATAEEIFKKKKELNFQEKLELLQRQAFLGDDAQAQKDIAQSILDNESANRALDLAEDKRVRDLKAANAIKSKADRERERQEEFDRLNAIIVSNNYWADELAKATEKGNEAVRARGQFSIQQLEFYQNQLQEISDEEAWALEERRIRTERANRAETEAADKANKEKLDKEKAFRQQLFDLATESALGTISALKELNSIYDEDSKEASEKAFNRSKALNIAEAIISTISSAQKAYQSQFSPIPDASSPARGSIAAAIAVAGGLARIAAIKAQKFSFTEKSPSSASIPSGGGGSVPAPQFNIVGQSGTNQLAQGIGAQFDQPVRAYVVGQDVTTSQQLQRQRVRTATFG
jgi:hypothetical protein